MPYSFLTFDIQHDSTSTLRSKDTESPRSFYYSKAEQGLLGGFFLATRKLFGRHFIIFKRGTEHFFVICLDFLISSWWNPRKPSQFFSSSGQLLFPPQACSLIIFLLVLQIWRQFFGTSGREEDGFVLFPGTWDCSLVRKGHRLVRRINGIFA